MPSSEFLVRFLVNLEGSERTALHQGGRWALVQDCDTTNPAPLELVVTILLLFVAYVGVSRENSCTYIFARIVVV